VLSWAVASIESRDTPLAGFDVSRFASIVTRTRIVSPNRIGFRNFQSRQAE
jgi:hypothetical protein